MNRHIDHAHERHAPHQTQMNEPDMNDLDALKDLRASIAEPSAARMAPGRARLTATIRAHTDPAPAPPHRTLPHRTPTSKAPTPLRIAAVVAAAAIAAAGVVLVSTHKNGHHGARTHNPSEAGKSVKAVLAAKVLRLAAAAAARNAAGQPSAGQWFYSKTVAYEFGSTPRTSVDEEWGTFDGKYTAYHVASKLVVHTDTGAITGRGATALDRFDATATPRTAYQALASLPSNPAALIAVISAHVAKLSPDQVHSPVEQYAPTSSSQVTFNYLVELMWNATDGEPPAAQANAYLAMAQLPGVTVQQGIRDAAGQLAIGVSDDGGIDQLLLDPHSYAVVGIREVSTGVSPFYVASKAQMIRRLLDGLKGRQLAEMKAQIRLHGAQMWRNVRKQNARPWPRRGAVVESLAISELKPVSGPGRR